MSETIYLPKRGTTEINLLTENTSPVSDDLLLIENSISGVLEKLKLSSMGNIYAKLDGSNTQTN